MKPVRPLLWVLATAIVCCGARYSHRDAGRRAASASEALGSVAAALPPDAERWIETQLTTLSVEHMVGQLQMVAVPPTGIAEDSPKFQALLQSVEQGHVGGIVLERSSLEVAKRTIERLQARAKLPLLIATSAEWGLGFRFEGATRFPSAMALGAAHDVAASTLQGRVTAREARSIGVHMIFGPVLDLNVNAQNSVINYRAYGAVPERVAELGSAFIAGLQDHGALAVAKHFPGHGATSADSHLNLPSYTDSRALFDARELAPFRAAIGAGVSAIMPAHVAYPAVEGQNGIPATFSSRLLTQLLRGEMGFKGLVVSDALYMQAVAKGRTPGDVALRAFHAGCDVLLMSPDPHAAHEALYAAAEKSTLPLERLRDSVRRILRAKAAVGLYRSAPQRSGSLPEFTASERGVRDAAAQHALTLLDNRGRMLPFSKGERTLLISFATDDQPDPSVIERELAARSSQLDHQRLTPTHATLAADVLASTAQFDRVVFASFARTRTSHGRGDLPRALLNQLTAVAAKRPLVVVSFGNPYVLTAFDTARARIAAYDFADFTQRAVARALVGEAPVTGKLPIALSEQFPLEHGIELRP